MSNPDDFIQVREAILNVARREDSELRRYSGQGIFLMPELAFVHQVAKELSSRSSEVFRVPFIRWEMDKHIGAGRTDLVINAPNQKGIAIEVKIGGSKDLWAKDIQKLKQINPNYYYRLFCSLAHSFVNTLSSINRVFEDDGTVANVGGDFDYFTTLHPKYQTQVCCVVGVWFVR